MGSLERDRTQSGRGSASPPPLNETIRFLDALYGGEDEGLCVYGWLLPSKRTVCYPLSDYPRLEQLCRRSNTHVYFGVGGTRRELSEFERPKAEEIAFIPGFWADIDLYSAQAHVKKNLPPDMAAVLKVLPDLEPTLIVHSGNGLHLYWLFRELWQFETDEERAEAAQLLQRWQKHLRERLAAEGWHMDGTHDLNRVLRLPGSKNIKTTPALPVKLVHEGGARYNPSEIEDYLDQHTSVQAPLQQNAEEPRQTERSASGFERRESDGQAENILKNCRYIQYCQQEAAALSYDEWVAMLSNLARASDGVQVCHDLSALDTARYDRRNTQLKIDEVLQHMGPRTCAYIQDDLHYRGCPEGGCGLKAPCAWAVDAYGRAMALLNEPASKEPSRAYSPKVIQALRTVERHDKTMLSRYRSEFRAAGISSRDLSNAMKTAKLQEAREEDETPDNARRLKDLLPDAPLDLRVPNGFRVDEYGIVQIKRDSDGNRKEYDATSTPVIITRRLRNIDTQSERLELQFRYRGHWHPLVVNRTDVADGRRLVQLADRGLAISSDTSKYLVKWFYDLQAMNDDLIPVVTAVSKLGWRDEAFILPTVETDIVADMLDPGSSSIMTAFDKKGSFDHQVEILNTARQEGGLLGWFLLAAGFAAPLLHIVKGRNFVLHNWGGSRGGKTALTTTSASIWGNPQVLMATFDQTPTNLERRAAFLNDLPFCIDEREVMDEDQRSNISAIVYRLASGKGKGRGTVAGMMPMETWRTIVLSTGEGPLSTPKSKDGEHARMLEIEGGPFSGKEHISVWLYEQTAECYGHAGAAFIERLLETDRGDIRRIYEELRSMLAAEYASKVSSQLDTIALIALAGRMAGSWVLGDSIEEARETAVKAARMIAGMVPTQVDISETERAWQATLGFVAENNTRYCRLGTDHDPLIWHGYIENGDIFILRTVLNEFLERNFSSSRKIIQDWGEDGRIGVYMSSGKKRYDRPCSRQARIARARVVRLVGAYGFDDDDDDE